MGVFEFWQNVRAIEANLPDVLHVIPVAGGAVSETTGRHAAELIARGTHRRATEEEIRRSEYAQRFQSKALAADAAIPSSLVLEMEKNTK